MNKFIKIILILAVIAGIVYGFIFLGNSFSKKADEGIDETKNQVDNYKEKVRQYNESQENRQNRINELRVEEY